MNGSISHKVAISVTSFILRWWGPSHSGWRFLCSKMSYVSGGAHATGVSISFLVFEMLVLAEFTKEREEHMQALYKRLIIGQLVHRNVKHWKDDTCITVGVHIYIRPRELHFFQSLLHFGIHLGHQLVEVWHLLRVVYRWRRSSLVQILHAIDPPRYVFRSLIRILYRLYAHGCSAHNVFTLDVLQLQNCFVLAVQGRLIQLSYTEVFLLPVRLRHLQAGVHLSHCWHVVWHERL